MRLKAAGVHSQGVEKSAAGDGRLCVRDVMSHQPVCVSNLATARQLARVLIEHNISGVPVVNSDGNVVGVVSKTDLLEWCVRGGLGFGAENLLRKIAEGGRGTGMELEDLGIVADFMSAAVLTTTPDELLQSVAQRMAAQRVHRLLVLSSSASTDSRAAQHSELVGIVTSLDVLRAFPIAR